MDSRVRWRMTRRLEFAVLLIDDFSGKLVTGSEVNLWVEESPKRKPVRKSDGYFLFLEEDVPIKAIRIEGTYYQSEIVNMEERRQDIRDHVLKIRLRPGRAYRFSEGITRIEGKAQPGSDLVMIFENAVNQPRLLQDYKKGEAQLLLFRNDTGDISGKQYVIKEKDKKETEIFTITGKMEDVENSFELKKPLKKNYKRAEGMLLPVYMSKADEKGRYVLPICDWSGKDCICSLSLNGGPWSVVTLEAGKNTIMNFM